MRIELPRFHVLIIVFFFVAPKAWSQKTEVGLLFGPTYYYGDIVNTFQPLTAKLGGSAFVRYHLDSRFGVRANFSFAQIGGSDEHPSNSEWQNRRNLTFKCNIFEVALLGEYNLVADDNKGRRVKTANIPYVFAGVGYTYFETYRDNPVTGEKNVSLRPLMLDGTSYQPFAISVPFGIGTRYYLNKNWTVGAEIGIRWTSTSQLDNVDGNSLWPSPETLPSDLARQMLDPSIPLANGSKLGQPGRERGKIEYINDIFLISGVTVSYRIWPKGVRKYGGKAIRCPRFY